MSRYVEHEGEDKDIEKLRRELCVRGAQGTHSASLSVSMTDLLRMGGSCATAF